MTTEHAQPGSAKYVLFDVDGTLIDAVANQRRVWETWAARHGLDPVMVHRVALRTRPLETFAEVAPERDPAACLAELHALEDEDVRTGVYDAFDGASELLSGLPSGRWALVTSNYEHRVRARFDRTGLPVPGLVVDAAAVTEGKPSPAPYLLAAERLGADPRDCLVVEDAPSGVASGLRAGMTVWAVNSPAPVGGAHRHFASLREAVPTVLAFAAGSPQDVTL
ncbi:HAD family phosphatase [Streptomyces sp. VRA16 Mangrove soil]|uniref:HAD family hydrolase n=1 Tax=Streptomyces sp. VRA16 Mangrove soil TaxID=2817434 RepID=UPI001A9F318A|nr:HAD-IA family hydrolase [Streptomyces sp. VRA16 Mangrove soil]MBO1329937.1 HAD-IA family hydrolase [Streptomyces sp. VRA16 Mangrove soil]